MKRVVLLVQTYLSIKSVELDIRPLTDHDETLDVRGHSMTVAPSATSSAPVQAVVGARSGSAEAKLTSADVDMNPTSAKRRTRKKRRSSDGKSAETAEEVFTEQVDKGKFGGRLLIIIEAR